MICIFQDVSTTSSRDILVFFHFHVEKIQKDPGFVKLERILPEVKENNRQKPPFGSLQQQPIVQLEKFLDLENFSKFSEGDGTNFEATKVELDQSVPLDEDLEKPNKPMVSQNFLQKVQFFTETVLLLALCPKNQNA